MFKEAMEYTPEELLRLAQDFFGGVYWAWFQAARKVVGVEQTNEILIELATQFAPQEIAYIKSLWGRDFEDMTGVTKTMDVIHRVLAYEGHKRGSVPTWNMESNLSGYEEIGHCPIHSTTPPEFQGKGPTELCTVYCHSIGNKVYALLNASIEQKACMPAGDSHCGFQVTMRAPENKSVVSLPSEETPR